MKICYLDAFSGISGDMTVGALLDAGAPADALLDALRSLDTGARFEVEKTARGGITASKFRVITPTEGHGHRHLKHILGPHARVLHDEDHIVQRLGACGKELCFGLVINEDIPATLF